MNPSIKNKIKFLQAKALALRIDSLRATTQAGSGHPTSCLSAADIIAALFFHFLRYDLKNPQNPLNDRFILSKGHAIPLVYAAWKHLGCITDEELMSLRDVASPLEGHPTPRFAYNEAATGSLGQGLGIGAGMALHAKKSDLSSRTYVMLGDGEIAEGSVWEAAAFASHYSLNNLIAILDCNRLGQSGESLDNHSITTHEKKWQAFGWKTYVIDGHDMNAIIKAFNDAQTPHNQPVIIIAQTIKGYGLDDIANKNGYHGKPFSAQELPLRIEELKRKFPDACKDTLDSYVPSSAAYTLPAQKKSIPLSLHNDPATQEFDLHTPLATRKAFGYALAALGRVEKNIFVLDADVKNSTYTEIFEKEFPEHFIQCFIAEQNMISVATGLHLRGALPFAATFACFLSRAFDQIRMTGIGRNALRVCGSHAGVSIGEDGPSQMGLEDIALMRSIPHSIVLYPSDGVSTYKLVELMAHYHEGLSYIRTTRAATPTIYDKNESFTVGGCKVLRQSSHDSACIVAAGITVHEALKAAALLEKENIFVAVIDLYSIKPFDEATVKQVALQSHKKVLTVEDHYAQGGIGEAVCQALINQNVIVKTLSVNATPRSGSPEKNLFLANIDFHGIIKAIKDFIKQT